MAARNTRRDSSGHLNPFSSRIRRYQQVLGPLGLWDSFARMPRRPQELFVQRKSPDPVLDFDPSFPADAEHRALRKQLQAHFVDATMTIEGMRITVRDFFAVIASLHAIV